MCAIFNFCENENPKTFFLHSRWQDEASVHEWKERIEMRAVRLGRDAARFLRSRRAGLHPHVCRAGDEMEHCRVETALLAELAPRVPRRAPAAREMGRCRPLVDEVLPYVSARATAGSAARS